MAPHIMRGREARIAGTLDERPSGERVSDAHEDAHDRRDEGAQAHPEPDSGGEPHSAALERADDTEHESDAGELSPGPPDNGGVRFTKAELEAFRDTSIPDLVGPGLRLLFVGINPGLWTAATQTPFAHPGNRFYPALAAAGIIPEVPAFADGFSEAEKRDLIAAGIGISNLVNRATVRADELTRDELRAGATTLTEKVAEWSPRVVAIVGITAYRQAFARPQARAGLQPEKIADAELWVVPNPSGLNAHDTVATLADAYAAPARAAGIMLHTDPAR